jgi:predicted ATPase
VLRTVAVENYRSLRRLVVGLDRVTVVTGANGSGKSSLYRALRLLADCSRNGAVAALARQGGLSSTLWAGPEQLSAGMRDGSEPVQGTRRNRPVELRLGFAGDEIGYCVDFGLPMPGSTSPTTSLFVRDPEIKRECTWSGPVLRPAALLSDRSNGAVRIRADDGSWTRLDHQLRPFDSMLSEIADPERAPELLQLREHLRSWRFYDHVRTDAGAPARASSVGTRTPVLSGDGADLAAALQTVRESGDAGSLDAAVDSAFPGSRIAIEENRGLFELTLKQRGLLRPLAASELSDGTLRYLIWVAALLTPDPPPLLVLNEPETSLHPDLLPALADLVRRASRESQIIVVTHSRPLVRALESGGSSAADPDAGVSTIELVKDVGQTIVEGAGTLDAPAWHWPSR